MWKTNVKNFSIFLFKIIKSRMWIFPCSLLLFFPFFSHVHSSHPVPANAYGRNGMESNTFNAQWIDEVKKRRKNIYETHGELNTQRRCCSIIYWFGETKWKRDKHKKWQHRMGMRGRVNTALSTQQRKGNIIKMRKRQLTTNNTIIEERKSFSFRKISTISFTCLKF